LHKEIKALKSVFDELNVSYERLEEAHKKLDKAHKKLENAYSSLINKQNEKEHVVTCDKCLTCDIIDKSFYRLSLLLPLTLLVAHPLLPHLIVMVLLVMPY
jgi:predicted nuclease with TOPRIM domain